MKRGEVWRVRAIPSSGRVQKGERPAIVVQNDSFAVLPTVLIVPLTGQQRATRFPGTLIIQPDSQNGLSVPSVALAFQLRVADRTDLTHCLGNLDAQSLADLDTLLRQLIL